MLALTVVTLVSLLIFNRSLPQNNKWRNANSQIPDFSHNTRKDAPNISFQNQSGQNVSLNSYKGKVVLLSFWTTFCGPCLEELPVFQKMQKEIGRDDFVVVPVSEDVELGEAKPFIEKFFKSENIKMTNFFDQDQAAATSFDVQTVPANFLIDRNGKIAFSAVGAQDWSDQSIQDLIADVLAETN